MKSLILAACLVLLVASDVFATGWGVSRFRAPQRVQYVPRQQVILQQAPTYRSRQQVVFLEDVQPVYRSRQQVLFLEDVHPAYRSRGSVRLSIGY